ncbi:hypothetical protein [Sphingomonas desiccabilis]|uniref:APCDD1 domain-containing protein n=1 Tax=Sphingomonas desiccabilis TaxID=429134 RepID=A0A4Q2IT41_9SPHN|nr:hypothetical protein [Sphingomonas desiccabilis]MBB3911577.1 hypothetical protein [Sphingomonas desiccabilis]RXZ31677.1 hypothetical protein EO081_10650 [Sphingomonas desiccabilis]
MTAIVALLLLLGASPPVQPPPIHGIWETACLPIGENGRHGVVTRVTLTHRRLQAVSQVYETRACDVPTFKLHFRGTLLPVQVDGGRWLLRHHVRAITLTPQAAAVVAQYNRADSPSSGCGMKGWKLGVARSVAGRRCAPIDFAPLGTLLYDAAWTDGEELRFGAFPEAWSNRSAGQRPTRPLPQSFRRVR